jgi:DNA segregation ATPase FtsK/SpoIIIE, S-DNA-T family
VADVIKTSQITVEQEPPACDPPEPLASVLAYFGADLNEDGGRALIPTAELVTALGIDRATLSRHLSELGCWPTRERIPTEDGTLRQVRGYLIADIRTTAGAIRAGHQLDTHDD